MITTKEIATKLGISRSTVSRVLNDNPNVSPKTRQRVLDALEKNNYVPNEAARSLTMRKTTRIAFIAFSEPKYFWKDIKIGIERALSELSHKGLIVDYFDSDINAPAEQIELVSNAIKNNYDGIAITPNDPHILENIINKAVDLGIPIALYNADMPNTKRSHFTGCNHYLSGRLAAEIFGKMLHKDKARISLFTIKDDIRPIKDRELGFKTELRNYSNSILVETQKFCRTGGDIYNTAKTSILQHNLDGIFIAIAGLEDVARAVNELYLNNNFILVGYDLNNSIKKYINNSAITAAIYQNPPEQSYQSILSLFNTINSVESGTAPVIRYTNLQIIMRNNLYHL